MNSTPEPLLTDLDSLVLEHLVYKLANATINLYPYPHFLIRDVFPPDFYGDLARSIHYATDYHEEPGRYHGRQFGRETAPSETDGLRGLLTKRFTKAALLTFQNQLKERYPDKLLPIYTDLRFIRDGRDYFIGPHTDAPWKLVSFLFYLPIHDLYKRHGTSIYLPKDPSFTCPGGPHHDFSAFTRIYTAPFLPNTLFAFYKTDRAFHGVELIDQDIQRDVLLWNAYDQNIYNETHKRATPLEQTAEKPSNAATDEQFAASQPET